MSRRTPQQDPYWNHNVHYHRLVLDAVPDGCGRALDIGCGDGLLVRKLAGRAREVTGVDRSADMIRVAREHGGRSPNAAFLRADFMTPDGGAVRGATGIRDAATSPPAGPGTGRGTGHDTGIDIDPESGTDLGIGTGYDFISAVAVLHHLDFAAALDRMTGLLAPGGRLVLIGLANNRTPLDWLISAAGVPAARILARRHGGKTDPPGMPVQDPGMAWHEVRRVARERLPGCRFRRHLLWRYSVVWEKPQGGPVDSATENRINRRTRNRIACRITGTEQ
ncbi:class I SAM-dependent methyltransferase [Streptomyces celluloflavus]|uniref:class I SAM-dependent methyltransferase n=1 Tax=Streptomyces celluloflavus TaxID=58344 RepID=UPI0036626FB3